MRSTVGHRFALLAVCAVLFLTFLDMTIVSVALGDVQSRLHAGVTQLQWIVNGYALTFASLMLLAGSLSDRLGRKRLILVGLAIFGGGSLLSALSVNPSMLIAGRVIMGIGAAASEPGTLSIIRHIYPERSARARALGIWAATSGLALAFGPLLGGILVAIGSWRAVFWFNVAFTALAMVLAWRMVPESADPQSSRVDLAGFVLGAVGIGALTFAVILGETNGYGSSLVVALFIAATVALVVFVKVERKVENPMLDLSYFSSPQFSGAVIVAFVLFFGIFSIFFFTALYLEAVVGYAPDRIAVEFLPMTVAMVVAAGLAGRLIGRIGPRFPLAEGCVLAAAGILLSDLLLHRATPSLWLIATLGLAGFGFGSSVVPVTSAALSAVPAEHSGMAASATNTSRELGAVFGVAVLGALVNAHLTADLTHRLVLLHVPSNFISVVINALENGTVPSGVKGASSIEDRVIQAAYGAFRSGLTIALLTSGIAIFGAGVVAATTLSKKRNGTAELETS